MIYIVRHGQTDWNLIKRNQGRIDIPLNETGIEQAKIIKEKLNNIKFDKVFSSPLKRAYETAQIISNEKIIIDNRLIERSGGELDGMYAKDIDPTINYNDPNENRYGLENIVDFRKRVNDFFEEITALYPNQDILVVTHAGVSIYAKCFFEGDPLDGKFEELKLKNCEVLTYENNKIKTNSH